MTTNLLCAGHRVIRIIRPNKITLKSDDGNNAKAGATLI